LFLPILLGLYFCAPARARNLLLTLASLVFYNHVVSLLFVALLAAGYVVFRLQGRLPATVEQPAAGEAS